MKKTYFFYILSCVTYGCNGLLVKHIAMESYEIAFLRQVLAGGFLLVIFLLTKGCFTFMRHKKQFVYLIISSVVMGISGLFLYEAFSEIGVSISTLLYYCGPIIVISLSPFLFKEKITRVKLLSVAVIITGIILVNGIVTGETYGIWGVFCGAMSAVCWAVMVIFNKKVADIRGMEKATLQICVGLLPVAGFMLIRQGFTMSVPNEAWPYVIVLGLVNTGLGSYFYFSSMGDLPVQTASILGYLEPLTAVVAAVLVLHEPMDVFQMIGAAMVIGGAIFGERVRPRKLKL